MQLFHALTNFTITKSTQIQYHHISSINHYHYYHYYHYHTSQHKSTPTILIMSKIVEDVKTGIKGIRGAGDAIRGEVLDATDQAFDNNQNHPQTQASQTKNRAIAEKGKQDVRNVDEMVGRREWERKGVSTTGTEGTGTGTAPVHHSTATGAPGAAAPTATGNGIQRAV
ncbi:hypothetical protein M426DRAFT_324997 [Hypoxylon sp. CI-4A]|nr:hypothetical protein M426DRAFT_324997 [Hypoxylon sp. CI-4A]